MKHILFNGNMIEEGNSINIEDRGYQFGDGIYEVIGIYNNTFFKMTEHLQRLERSAKEVKIKLPYSLDQIKSKLEQLLMENNVLNGIVYLQISRGVAPRNHPFPQPTVDPVIIAYTKTMEQPKKEQNEGINCILTDDIRWLRCDIKSLNLLGNVLAKQKAFENGCFEAIFHRGDIVTEGSSTNFFIVKDEQVYTHPANNFILNGITRGTVLEICNVMGLRVVEEPFTIDQLYEADEAFISGTYIDLVPVNNVDAKEIGSGKPGPITKKIQEKFNTLIG